LLPRHIDAKIPVKPGSAYLLDVSGDAARSYRVDLTVACAGECL
jgi:hypothetical protein